MSRGSDVYDRLASPRAIHLLFDGPALLCRLRLAPFGISPLRLSLCGLFSGPDAARNRFVSTPRGPSALAKRVLNCSADGI